MQPEQLKRKKMFLRHMQTLKAKLCRMHSLKTTLFTLNIGQTDLMQTV